MISDKTGFIFDLDGVLVDTAKYHFLAWKRLAAELSYDFGIKENEQLKGVSRADSLDKILSWAGVDMPLLEKEKMMARKNQWYLEYVDAMDASELLPGSIELLDYLHSTGRKIALGSASKNALRILERTGIRAKFDAIIDGTSTSRSKPDPQVFLLGAKQLGLEPSACVVFEDSEAGLKAARNAGMTAVGIGRPADLCEADMVIPNLDLLLWNLQPGVATR